MEEEHSYKVCWYSTLDEDHYVTSLIKSVNEEEAISEAYNRAFQFNVSAKRVRIQSVKKI